jgi:hypothetical protein
MSALGHKRTLQRVRLMSALPPKADIAEQDRDVRFVPKADIQGLQFARPRRGGRCSQSAACRTAEGPVLTEIGKPMLGIESGKNFPARIAGCSSSNDWPLAYA